MKFVRFALSSLLVLALAGCTTVTPKIVRDETPSWDGNEQNSGFYGLLTDGCGVWKPHAIDRYNALIERYGTNYAPAITKNYGVQCCYTNGTSIMTPEAMDKFGEMNRWRKSGL